ncbi:MAG: YHS domain-containing protein [Anaerolineae bacterium CG_4_9_14_3_um_filter_57_17]|nr:MAG: YHS domain-containing protein [Anaerolineae bacterium CG_4_9_14_3_um_filter_57_17]
MTKDPVCEMEVEPQSTKLKSLYQGKTYYFCSAVCKGMFDRDPKKYAEVPFEPRPKG